MMKKCPNCNIIKSKEDYYKNSGRCKACDKIRYAKYKKTAKGKEYDKNYDKLPNRRILANLRRRVREVLQQSIKIHSTSKNIGCTPNQLKQHLEAQFEPGMNWDNYGNGINKWNIDHIVPLSKCEDKYKANYYTNLRPMWSNKNSARGNRF